MVIPTGQRYQQTLYLFTKKEGKLEQEFLRPTLFVPMTGAAEEARNMKPDPLNPVAVNGDFEDISEKDDIVPGWYYGRQVELVSDSRTPQGKYHVQFTNSDNGRGSQLLQGLAVDGRKVSRLRMSTFVACQNVKRSLQDTMPTLMITFYDQNRQDVGKNWLGPWWGTTDWKKYAKTIRVPQLAREAIIRIGLFGATGKASFDDVRIGRL